VIHTNKGCAEALWFTTDKNLRFDDFLELFLPTITGRSRVIYFMSMSSICLEKKVPVRIPQLDFLVTAASQTVRPVNWKTSMLTVNVRLRNR
jgi:hypothetical protein